jgi:RNA methyltransferase, TrmH family
MVSKNQIKTISSLHQKKYRKINELFIAEGQKTIAELISAGFVLDNLFVTEQLNLHETEIIISETDLKKISALKTPNNCLAVFKTKPTLKIIEKGLILVLDNLQDPGNLGTIIRLADWFGVAQIICSEETVDLYNPKVVQATMGSLARTEIIYTDIFAFLKQTKMPIYGTFMDGENIYKNILPTEAIIVMGNEGNGISKPIEALITQKIAIPRFGTIQKTESLNVSTATAIILSEFCRTTI